MSATLTTRCAWLTNSAQDCECGVRASGEEARVAQEMGEALAQADRTARQSTGHALSPSWRSMPWTQALRACHRGGDA